MTPLTETGNLGESLGPRKISSFWKREILSSIFAILPLDKGQGMWTECHRQENSLREEHNEKTKISTEP